jgi:acetyltransferase-like isoleucine patch superfamily enzyme
MIRKFWVHFWMIFSGRGVAGRVATRMAAAFHPPYFGRCYLAGCSPKGYIAPDAQIHHKEFRGGRNIFLDSRVLVFQAKDGGPVKLAERVRIFRDTIIQTGAGGSVSIGAGTHVQPRCIFSAFKSPITIGNSVQIAPGCAFYPYSHGISRGRPISEQPLVSKGGITIDDDAWLGFGVVVLDGVRIGKGAVIGAGAVVTKDVPDGAIAAGAPARVIKFRDPAANIPDVD